MMRLYEILAPLNCIVDTQLDRFQSISDLIASSKPQITDPSELRFFQQARESAKTVQELANLTNLPEEQKAELWLAAQNLIYFLKQYHSEKARDLGYFYLLTAVQQTVEPAFALFSKEKQRNHLNLIWSRLKSKLETEPLLTAIDTQDFFLTRWLNYISNALASKEPTIAKNQLAYWAVSGLLEKIAELPSQNQLDWIVPILKQIRKITS